MVKRVLVPDANIFLEMIYARPLSDVARKLISDAIVGKNQLLVPSLFLDEITEVLCGNMDNLSVVQKHLEYIENLITEAVILIVVPDYELRMKAIKIAREGHPKSGYHEFSGSLYHALTIDSNALFVTNDHRHFAKVKRLGYIIKLEEYNC